jgi:hypothetical protein
VKVFIVDNNAFYQRLLGTQGMLRAFKTIPGRILENKCFVALHHF